MFFYLHYQKLNKDTYIPPTCIYEHLSNYIYLKLYQYQNGNNLCGFLFHCYYFIMEPYNVHILENLKANQKKNVHKVHFLYFHLKYYQNTF
jgi:hypothetical protein